MTSTAYPGPEPIYFTVQNDAVASKECLHLATSRSGRCVDCDGWKDWPLLFQNISGISKLNPLRLRKLGHRFFHRFYRLESYWYLDEDIDKSEIRRFEIQLIDFVSHRDPQQSLPCKDLMYSCCHPQALVEQRKFGMQ